MKENTLDQFYTNPIVSDKLVGVLFRLMPSTMNSEFLEPAAGTGNFINSLIKNGIHSKKITGYDLDPKSKKVLKEDYLKESNIVAMILPNIFNRYIIQKNIDVEAKLIYSQSLKENSFIFKNSEYSVKCVFQIWTKCPTYQTDLRIKEPPKIKHEDFKTWIHNNTIQTLKYFDKQTYKWDFAVHRQGYYDYNKIIENEEELIKNRQYFFVKAKNKQVLKKLKKINYDALSKTNTQVLGFSTSDFVNYYTIMTSKERGV